jgi:16S rRNA (uracil1498-N3)-methyltransferase
MVDVFDGEGAGYAGRLAVLESEWIVADLEPIPVRTESQLDLVLALALIKADRFEWAIEKATELGVRAIVPLAARRSDIRIPAAKLPQRLERWRRIAREAAKQCRRGAVPRVEPPVRLDEYVARENAGAHRLLFSETAAEPWDGRVTAARRIDVIVGPEGGWTAEETRAAGQAGCRMVGFGPRILRAETAAVAALALVQFQAGDLAIAPSRKESP